MRIKRKYVSSAIILALCLWALYKISFVDVPLLYLTGQNSPWYDLDEKAFADIAAGQRTFIILKNWRGKVNRSGITSGDQIIADDLDELYAFLRDKPDAVACVPWYQAAPEFRLLRYFGAYFWDAEYYPAVRCFSWGWIPKYRSKNVRNITFGGAVALGRDTDNVIERTGDVNFPWQRVSRILRKADLTVVQLESPLVYNYVRPRAPTLLYGKAAQARGLDFAGVDAAALTGAHLGDAGVNGLNDTLDILEKLNIKKLGVGVDAEMVYQPEIFRLGNVTVAVLAGEQSKAAYTETDLRGRERSFYASSDPDLLLRSAEQTTADAIFVLADINSTQENIFSVTNLGGLIFDRAAAAQNKGRIRRYFFYKKKLAAVDTLPVFLSDRWYTELQ